MSRTIRAGPFGRASVYVCQGSPGDFGNRDITRSWQQKLTLRTRLEVESVGKRRWVASGRRCACFRVVGLSIVLNSGQLG